MDLYAENILDHYRHPRCKQSISNPTVSHKEENLSCGDVLELELTIENNAIKEIGWSGTGCAISQAAMSMLTEDLESTKIEDIEKMTPENIYELLGVPIGLRRVQCALLGLQALQNALLKAR